MLRLQYFYIYSFRNISGNNCLKKWFIKHFTALINDNGYCKVFTPLLGIIKQCGNMITFKSNKLLGFNNVRVNILFNGLNSVSKSLYKTCKLFIKGYTASC